MSATAQATNRPAWMNKPAWGTTKSRIRRMATEQGRDAEALSLHYFDTALDNLLDGKRIRLIENSHKSSANRLQRANSQAVKPDSALNAA